MEPQLHLDDRSGLYLPGRPEQMVIAAQANTRRLLWPKRRALSDVQQAMLLPAIRGGSGETSTWVETLYAMPVSGPAVTAAAKTIMSGNSAANPPYLLRANFFNPPAGPGKSLMLKGGGWGTIGGTAVTDVFECAMNTTQGTGLNTVAKTGVFTTLANMTNFAFEFEIFLTVTITGNGATNAGSINCVGHISFGAANNAAAPTWGTFGNAVTTFSADIMIGTPQTAVTLNPLLAYFIELFNTWNVTTGAPTITMTNFYIFGLN